VRFNVNNNKISNGSERVNGSLSLCNERGVTSRTVRVLLFTLHHLRDTGVIEASEHIRMAVLAGDFGQRLKEEGGVGGGGRDF
jgi:hypothetical protein